MWIWTQRNQHILLALLDLVQNARTPQDLEYVYDLSLTLITYGANPDVRCSTEPTICQSQSSMFIKRSSDYVIESYFKSLKLIDFFVSKVLFNYIHYLLRKEEQLIDDSSSEQPFMKMIFLYYQTMSHNHLFSCLQQLNRELLIGSLRSNSVQLTTLLRNLCRVPVSLKDYVQT